MKREVSRKLIHVSTALTPVAVWALPRPLGITVLTLAVAGALLLEWARLRCRWARYHFLRRVRTLLRSHERHGLAGATYMALAYLLALLLFPKPVAVAAMLFNALGDAAAALVGRRWGRHRTRWGKSWEGAGAGAVVCMGVALAVPGIPWPAAVAGGVMAAALEFLPLPLDDNLRITLGGGAALWLAVALL